MQKNLFSLFVIALALNANSQVYLIDENFDGVTIPALPEGWTTTTNFDIGFRTEDAQSSDNATASGMNNVVMRNTDSTGVYTLYSPVFSTEGLIDVQLLWASRVSNNYLSPGSTTPILEYSANGGFSWAALTHSDNTNNSTWAIVNDSLPIALPVETFNNPQVQLRWTVNIVNDPSGSYRMDDVKVWGTENPYVNLRLLVNMMFQPLGGEDIYTAGDFNGWDTGSAVMTDMGGSIYEYVVPVLRNSLVKFRFYNGSTIGAEIVPDSCGVDDGIGLGIARLINIGQNDTVYGPVCFGECTNCIIVEPVFVSFDVSVDMSQQTVDSEGVFVVGNFGDGSAEQTIPLVPGADNVYSANIEILEGTNVGYRFRNGSADTGLEVVPPACGVLNAESVYVREAFIGSENIATDTVCFSECAACVLQSVIEFERVMKLWPNPAGQVVFIQVPYTDARGLLRLYNMEGKLCREMEVQGSLTEFDVNDEVSGIYTLIYLSRERVYRQLLSLNTVLTKE